MQSSSSLPLCPKCNSSAVIKKGKNPRRFKCKCCGKTFKEKYKLKQQLDQDSVENYFSDFSSLTSLQKFDKHGFSRTTLHRRIRQSNSKDPDWDILFKLKKSKNNSFTVMGIDTTNIKINCIDYVYIHVIDVTTQDPIAYLICNNENSQTIKIILRKLRVMGYKPDVVITDLARTLLTSIKSIFPNAIIQGCIFHLRKWLNKELPTRNFTKEMTHSEKSLYKQKMSYYEDFKDTIVKIAISKNKTERDHYLIILDDLCQHPLKDKKINSVFKRFMKNLKQNIYRTLDEYKSYSGSTGPHKSNYEPLNDILYNNYCESHIKQIKCLYNKMCSFKTLDTAQEYVKAFWFFKRKQKNIFEEITYEKINSCKQILKSQSDEFFLQKTIANYTKIVATKDQLPKVRKKLQRIPKATNLYPIEKRLEYARQKTLSPLKTPDYHIRGESSDPKQIPLFLQDTNGTENKKTNAKSKEALNGTL